MNSQMKTASCKENHEKTACMFFMFKYLSKLIPSTILWGIMSGCDLSPTTSEQ